MKVRALLREVGAFAHQLRHLHRDWSPSLEGNSHALVVLVHGLYATAGVLRPIREHLTARLPVATMTFSHPPGVGFVEIAGALQTMLASASHSEIHLVGHSLGGLGVLEFLRRGGDVRVRSSATLAAPLLGSPLHRLAIGRAGPDLDDGHRTRALTDLKLSSHLSILAGDDLLIRGQPDLSSGRKVVVPGVGHNGLLFDERVKEILLAHIRENLG